jgi:hypothetical protein
LAKWADYLISKVRYNEQHTRIIKVIQHLDNDASVGGGTEVTRLDVVDNLKKGKTYCTIYWNNTQWSKGDNVIPYKKDGEYFIRTDGNKIEQDNLGNLPEF